MCKTESTISKAFLGEENLFSNCYYRFQEEADSNQNIAGDKGNYVYTLR